MLVLSRKSNECIVIGGEIEVIVLEVIGDRVKLGFNAPASVSIRREELKSRPRPSFNARKNTTVQKKRA